MNSYLVYRASLYFLLTVSSAILTVDVTDSRFDWLLPIAIGVVALFSFLSVDQGPRWALPRDLANLVGLGTLTLLYFEYKVDESPLIRCLGHWVTYLLLIKCLLPKTARDDWVLFLLGVTQVVIGATVNPGDILGVWLFLWSMLAVWVLGLFFLQRESRRFDPESSSAPFSSAPPQVDPYRGLFDLPYVAATLRVLALTLVLGSLFFLLLPRQPGVTRNRTSGTMSKHLTGFDEEVKLGQLGEILENDSVVMSVEFADEERMPARPATEPLWRGVSLVRYESGSWKRQQQRTMQTIVSMKAFRNTGPVKRKVIRQVIKLEPNDSPILFALRPILELSAGQRLPPYMNPTDGTIFRPEGRGGYDYEVLSDTNLDAPQESEEIPSEARLETLLSMPGGLKARFREIALPLVEDIKGEDGAAIAARARAIESYLRESGEFGYTLEMDVVDPSLDPVEDFLVNRKRGHCEYFASAMALLLRSIDIPARMVNGFKGGDWNELTQSMNVRQKHAHSWVEAYIGVDGRNNPLWITLDPTPATDREESVAHVGGIATSFRPFTDMVRYIWVFYILGYDRARQNRLFYAPISAMVEKVRQGYSLLWGLSRNAFAQLFSFQSLGAFISFKGFLVSFLVLSLVAVAFRLLLWLSKRLFLWWRGPIDELAGLTPGLLFYRRLAQMLAELDLSRNSAETQHEFAVRASRFLSGRGDGAQAVAEVPRKVVDAFYRVRFGHRELDGKTLGELEASLDSLQDHLNTS